ncbi:HAD-IIIC family phosphatase [Vibrio cyclitrophicus]
MKNKIKLVIWDLDETFWNGTLSEEGINPNDKNISIVQELALRGIISSISSKNDYEKARKALEQLEVWDFFVFPKINWSPKGVQVKNTIEEMGLRPHNVLFIDDNKMNLNEVESFCEGITVKHPDDILTDILDIEAMQGKDDHELSRLKQYKVLETKVEVKNVDNLSNVDFLKQSDIKIYFDFDYKSNLDRIYELIERTNQLNYTKDRLRNNSDKESFLISMEDYRSSSALIFCEDKFGYYGAIGFYQLITHPNGSRDLKHFVFSCRTLNMGVESFVYEYLSSPAIKVVEPVANEVTQYNNVDWIKVASCPFDEKDDGNALATYSTLMLGPCHLLQLSNFIHNTKTFVHYYSDMGMIKFDCPAFLMAKDLTEQQRHFVDEGATWSTQEFESYHQELKKCERIVLGLSDLVLDYDVVEVDGLYFRADGINKNIFDYSFSKLSLKERVSLLSEILNNIISISDSKTEIYILGPIYSPSTPLDRLGFMFAYDEILENDRRTKGKSY